VRRGRDPAPAAAAWAEHTAPRPAAVTHDTPVQSKSERCWDERRLPALGPGRLAPQKALPRVLLPCCSPAPPLPFFPALPLKKRPPARLAFFFLIKKNRRDPRDRARPRGGTAPPRRRGRGRRCDRAHVARRPPALPRARRWGVAWAPIKASAGPAARCPLRHRAARGCGLLPLPPTPQLR